MVAVISSDHNMSKEVPVVVMPETSEEKSSQKKHVILTSWASVATALLLMLLIGGAFYVADLKSRECTKTTNTNPSDHKTKNYTRTYDRDGEKTSEDFYEDEDDQTELIIKKSDDGNIEMITAIDYKRKISASYVPQADQCLLLSGIDMDWVDNSAGEKNKTVKVSEDQVEDKSYMVSDNKVTDLSILPSAMKPYCQGKATYWMQPKDDDSMEVGRQKRGRCLCRKLMVRCKLWPRVYCYYYWYYYSCWC